MNRKGILIPVVAVFGIILLLYATYSIYSDVNKPATEIIGRLQTDMIKLQLLGEKRVFYIDQLAKQSGYNAAKELAYKGGFADKCETWDLGECNPVLEFEKEFEKQFETEFYALAETAYFEKDIPRDYEFTIKLEKGRIIVTGMTKKEISLNKIEEYKIFYGVNPSFKQEIGYTTADYLRLVELLSDKKFVDCVRNSLDPDKTCEEMISAANKRDFEWNIDKDANIAKFTATHKNNLPALGKVVYKFAIDLNKSPFLKISAI